MGDIFAVGLQRRSFAALANSVNKSQKGQNNTIALFELLFFTVAFSFFYYYSFISYHF